METYYKSREDDLKICSQRPGRVLMGYLRTCKLQLKDLNGEATLSLSSKLQDSD